MKIKTFRFSASRCALVNGELCCKKDETDTIDQTVNAFICAKVRELIDVKVTKIDCRYHNNGGYNTIDLIYTIVYNE